MSGSALKGGIVSKMKPQIANSKMNKILLRSKLIKLSVFSAIIFSVVMMTGYKGFTTSVFITDRGVTKEIKTNEKDIYEILRDENYSLAPEDRISYTKDENNEGHITIHRAFDVEVKADGEIKTVTVISGKVSDILEKAGIKLGASDKVSAALDEEVTAGELITVTRIRYSTRKTEEEIEFDTEYIDCPNIAIGYSKTLTEGENGTHTVEYRDTYIDGKLSRTETISDKITKEPVTAVVERGTSLSTPWSEAPEDLELVNGRPTEYTRIVSGKATAYSAYPGARTASGRYAVVGTVAVNPNVIPYGSELYIVSSDGTVYGYAIAADTGLALMDGRVTVDVFCGSYEDSVRWGVHYVDIYVLSEGNG